MPPEATPALSYDEYLRWSKSLRNYEWLEGTCSGGTDLDLCIHRRTTDGDRFLFFEFKAAGERIPRGQYLLLNALRGLPNSTVAAVYGPDRDGMYVLGGDWSGKVDLQGLRDRVSDWWSGSSATEGNTP